MSEETKVLIWLKRAKLYALAARTANTHPSATARANEISCFWEAEEAWQDIVSPKQIVYMADGLYY